MAKQELTKLQRGEILMKAAIEISPDLEYEIRNGTMGMTLYIYVSTHKESKRIREAVPHQFGGIRAIVICTEKRVD